mmetsp:Transcript_11769/g.23669  ORF Transcript_11769/g.23669 Transcript_11769/m.23669 type:complete len:244 (-) Transcript_11769:1684-2415(-)
MLGYDKEDNWFWVLTPNRKIIKTTNVRFFDLQFQFPKAPSPDDTKVPPIEHLDASGGDDNKNNDEAQEFKTPEQDQKHSQDSTARRLTQDFHRDEAQDSKTPSSTTRNLIDDFDQEDDADDDDEDSINDDEDSKHDEKTTQDSKKEAPRSSLNNLRKPEGSWSSAPVREQKKHSEDGFWLQGTKGVDNYYDQLFAVSDTEPQSYKEAKEQGRWEKPTQSKASRTWFSTERDQLRRQVLTNSKT